MRKKAVLWGICFFLQMSFITWGITLSAILRRLSILPKISRHFNHGKHGKHGKKSTTYQTQYLRTFMARYLSDVSSVADVPQPKRVGNHRQARQHHRSGGQNWV